MMLVKGKDIKDIDRRAMKDYGIPGMVLMENAALRLVEFLMQTQPLSTMKILFLAGKGNNGGDALAAFRHLVNLGYDARLVYAYDPDDLKGDAASQVKILKKMRLEEGKILRLQDVDIQDVIGQADLLVDGLFGTGFHGTFPKKLDGLYESYQASAAYKLAIDLPSGLDADTGQANRVLEADASLTLGLAKLGLVMDQDKRGGELYLADISLPGHLLSSLDSPYLLADKETMAKLLVRRKASSHKGSMGKLTICGGSVGLSGAVSLAAEAAVRAGAGLVTALIPAAINDILEKKLTEAMTLPLGGAGAKSLGGPDLDAVLGALLGQGALVLGPGLGRQETAKDLVKGLVDQVSLPMVVDADALYHLAQLKDKTTYDQAGPRVMTPHEGEAARLLDLGVEDIRADRLGALKALHKTYGGVILLKGSRTMVYDGQRTLVNISGNPGMATGGAGDVLSGILGTYLAQGLDPFWAASLAAYIHGLSGDLAAQAWGENTMKAGDMACFLGKAEEEIKNLWPRQGHIKKIL